MTVDGLVPKPSYRKLRVYALDPSVSAQYDTAGIGEITIAVPWEDLDLGPVGEYIEVVDVDPASNMFYKPVDLNNKHVLAQDGLPPSEGNPQFHQQMVYAVAMATIRHFEQALGRTAFWASHSEETTTAGRFRNEFVRRLRIYPHALRDRNAYYSPKSKSILFGYFPIERKDKHNAPGTLVFTCLSHDIIAHEVTHALLDGVHPRFNEPVNADVHAFHEAFADIVALFQHFSYPGVLRDQIARTRGNLANESMLAQLAQQFGRAAGRGGALRDALGEVNKKTKKWERKKPDARLIERTREPHARGAILVAAVFDTFLKVYRARTVDLYRIATEGTGILRDGDIHPDLSARLAEEAAACALRVLQMCIRAIDYCPPVGITFGDYLRGVVTADCEINPDDTLGYRLAFIESFRLWGIQPAGVKSMSTTALLWPTHAELTSVQPFAPIPGPTSSAARPANSLPSANEKEVANRARDQLKSVFTNLNKQLESDTTISPGAVIEAPDDDPIALSPWDLEINRYDAWLGVNRNGTALWNWLMTDGEEFAELIGLIIDAAKAPQTVFRNKLGKVSVEVHSVRRAQRRTPRGSTVIDLVVEITQRRRGYFDADKQKTKDRQTASFDSDNGDFIYRAGCTLLMNSRTLEILRVIKTRGNIADDFELERQRKFLTGGGLQEGADSFASPSKLFGIDEPFAMLHSGED